MIGISAVTLFKKKPQIGNVGKNNLNTNQRLDGGALQPTSLVVVNIFFVFERFSVVQTQGLLLIDAF